MAEPATLAALTERLTGNARERDQALQALGLVGASYPQLPALEEFRALHARLRARQQLKVTLQPPPADAGPLNSASLAHRALALMRETSPGYLRHFVDYLDTLSWLQAQAAAAPEPARPPRRARKPRPARAGKSPPRKKPGA